MCSRVAVRDVGVHRIQTSIGLRSLMYGFGANGLVSAANALRSPALIVGVLGFAAAEMCESEPQERRRLRTRRGCYADHDPSDRRDRDSEESSGLHVLLDAGERIGLRRVLEKRVTGRLRSVGAPEVDPHRAEVW